MASKKQPILARLRTRLDTSKELLHNPRKVAPLTKEIFVRVWRTRGGGWYGIGYIITFIYREIRLFGEDIVGADSLYDFATEQFFQSLVRWFSESIINMVQAFLWPLRLIELTSPAIGIAILFGIHFAFEYFVRPIAEGHIPELKQDRLERESSKRNKRERKHRKRGEK